jgi:hypothetical protein
MDTPTICTEPVREAEGESTWETCDQSRAQAWRVSMTHSAAPWRDRAWTYKRREDAAGAALDLLSGRPQPLKLSGFARTSPRTVYLS